VSSVELSSTTMISTRSCVCRATLSMASPRYFAALNAGMITLTSSDTLETPW
jgi:hypothetical protein